MPDSQQQINYGNSANDGTGDPLRTAFIKVDDNFDAIWNAGPVGSNITVLNNTIASVNVNGNIGLSPDGTGMVLSAGTMAPALTRSYDLGTANLRWRNIYANTVTANNITYNGNVFTGNLEGNVLYSDGETLLINNVTGNITANSATISGNLSAAYILGNGSQLTGLPEGYANADAVSYAESGWAGNIIPAADGIYSLGNAANQWSELYVSNATIYIGGVALSVTGNTLTVAGEPVLANDSDSSITTTGNISANAILTDNYFYANGAPFVNDSIGNLEVTGTTIGLAGGATESTITVGNTSAGLEMNLDSGAPVAKLYAYSTDQAYFSQGGADYSSGTYTTGQITLSGATNVIDFLNTLQGQLVSVTVNGTDTVAISSYGYGGGTVTLYTPTPPSVDPTTVTEIEFNTQFENRIVFDIDEGDYGIYIADHNFDIESARDVRIVAGDDFSIDVDDSFDLRSRSTQNGDGIRLITDDLNVGYTWLFENNGVLTAPGNISAANFIGNVAAANVTGLANVATSGSYNDLSDKPTIPSLGNFSLTNNTIQTSNGGLPLTLSIFGADGADPPSLVNREWTFANTGAFSSPGAITATGNITGANLTTTGNLTVDNVTVSRNLTAQSVSTSAGLTGYAVTANTTVTATGNITGGNIGTAGNITAGNILTDGYFYANGDPFVSSNYGDANVVFLLSSFGSNTITTTGNITAANFEGNISITGNVTGTSSNVELVAGSYEWAFDNAGNLTLPGNTFAVNYANGTAVQLGGAGDYGDSNVVSLLSSFGSNTITTTGNVTGGNLISSATIFGNIDLVLGDTANASATKARIVNFGASSYIQTGNGTTGSTGNIVFAPYTDATEKVVINTATGDLTAVGNVTADNVLLSGNITGSSANVTITANAFVTTFDTTGLVTFPGNVTVNGNLFASGTDGNVVTKFESTWTVPTGNSTQSFTVDANYTYYLWVEGNIANGIIAWNATATVTNTNVPVVGAQYAWVYDGGGTPIDFTSLPNQFVGTANTIVRSSLAPSATTNRFDFGINNTSGSEQTVRYGWVRIS